MILRFLRWLFRIPSPSQGWVDAINGKDTRHSRYVDQQIAAYLRAGEKKE